MKYAVAAWLAAFTAFTPPLAHAATFQASTPQEAARAIVSARAGDTVRLAPGRYGKLRIYTGTSNLVAAGNAVIRDRTVPLTGPATITSADPANPAVLYGIETRDAPFWVFDSLRVSPTTGPQSIAIRIQSPDTVLSRNRFGHDTYARWTTAEWKVQAARMVFSDSPRTLVTGNTFNGVFHAIIFTYGADESRAENNVMRGIGGDGIDVSANNVQIVGNDMAEFYKINGNHDDCLQAWAGPGVNATGTNSGLKVIANRCLVHTNLDYRPASPDHPPMSNALQGYSAFNGQVEDCLIKDNWGLLTAYHGINFIGATNCRYENNRVIDATGANKIWVRVGKSDGVRQPSGNTIMGNIANRIPTEQGATYSQNRAVTMAEYGKLFMDWRKGDLRLAGEKETRFNPLAPSPRPRQKPSAQGK